MAIEKEYANLERQMRANNCSEADFSRVKRAARNMCDYDFRNLQTYMGLAKGTLSLATAIPTYLLCNYVAQQITDDNIIPKIAGGLAALVAAKLVAKPAARAGLDLGLRV